jgi:hypothetical protein
MTFPGQHPDVIAMILAEWIHKDRATGKYSILGTFNGIFSSVFPFAQPSLCVFLALTDGRGRTGLEMRLVDMDEVRPPIFVSKHIVDFPDPVAVQEIIFIAQSIVIPQPGEYRLQLLSENGELLRERRFFVTTSPRPLGGKPEEPGV